MPRIASPIRLPDATMIEAVLSGLDPAAADAERAPALTAAFAEFEFSVVRIDDDDWRDKRVCLRDRDAGVLLHWAARSYGF